MHAEPVFQGSLPDDVLLQIAEFSFDFVTFAGADGAADFPQLLSVHPTFLHVGLAHRYAETSLNCSERSVEMLQRMSSEPLLVSRIRTLSLSLYTPYGYWSRPARIDEQLLVNALMQAIPMITQLHRLEIMWGEFYDDADIDETDPYEAQPTIALSVFAPALRALWTQVAPTLRELRADVYIDALSVVAAFDASLAHDLRAVDLRVYGGVLQEATDPAGVEANCAAVARALVLPAAGQLADLNVCFVPCNSRARISRNGPNAPYSILPAVPEPLLDGFFELLRASCFPRLRHLGVAACFLGSERPMIADLITVCLRYGSLESLRLAATFPQGYSQYGPVIPQYMQMVREHGGRWGGLRTASLCFLDDVRIHRPDQTSVAIAAFMHPFLTASASLQELSFTGHFMEDRVLRETLQALYRGGGASTLRRLAIKIATVHPSTFDVLRELAPSIEYLHLEIIRALPDGEITPALKHRFQAEMDLCAVRHAARRAEFAARGEWCHEFRDKERNPTTLANERLFMIEMSALRLETWTLRRAAIVKRWSSGCVVGLAPPRDATIAAAELQRSVPGLVLTEVRPKANLWWS